MNIEQYCNKHYPHYDKLNKDAKILAQINVISYNRLKWIILDNFNIERLKEEIKNGSKYLNNTHEVHHWDKVSGFELYKNEFREIPSPLRSSLKTIGITEYSPLEAVLLLKTAAFKVAKEEI